MKGQLIIPLLLMTTGCCPAEDPEREFYRRVNRLERLERYVEFLEEQDEISGRLLELEQKRVP